MKLKSALGFSIACGVLAAMPLTASAQFAKKEDAIKYRQSAFALTGAHMNRIGAVVKGEAPFNAAEVQKSAALIATLSTLPWEAFGPGTEGGKAKPAVWKEIDKVKAGADKFMKAAADLNTAAKSGNLEQIKKAFGATGQTCKACHDDYRDK
ncbi:MAG: cytochrome c [Burkholderiaceae bacterium]|nr:cytochrome c [Burkholderiaceae bacterium]